MRIPRPWLIVLACLTGLVAFTPPVFAAPAETGLSPRTRAQIEALAAAKMARTPTESKVESSLLTAAQLSRGQVLPAGVRVRSAVRTDAGGRTRVVIYAKVTPALLARIPALGGVLRSSRPQDGVVAADLPVGAATALAELPEVRRISSSAAVSTTSSPIGPRAVPLTKQQRDQQLRTRIQAELAKAEAAGSAAAAAAGGPVVSEGDQAHGAAQARSSMLVSGVGVTVGVLSDGVDSLGASVAAGNLPPGVNVLAGGQGDEGTAMLEIVHDLAPKAKLAFAAAGDSQEDFAAQIRALRAAGADVIVDDILFYTESPFQDGPVAQAVADVTRDGALYFSSAGNEGNVDDATSGNYEATFRSSGQAIGKYAGPAHDFDPGPGVQVVDPTPTASPDATAVLSWADPSGAAGDDYDLYAIDDLGNVTGFSNDTQNGDDRPMEIFGLPGGGPVHLVVVKFKGADRYFQLTVFSSRFAADGTLKAYVSPGVTRGHSTVPAAFSVAAAPAHAAFPDALEPGDPANPSGPFPGQFTRAQKSERFTSDGPRRIFFRADGTPLTPGNFTSTGGQLRTDPDLTAADGVRTGIPGYDPFFGTSAAAPHAAAIAALALSGHPGLTAAEFRRSVERTALDIEGPGPDRDTGRGLLMAEPVLADVGVQAQPFVTAGSPTVTSTTDGDAFLEPGERAVVAVPVANTGEAAARNTSVILRSATPGVSISPPRQSYRTLLAGAQRTESFTVTAPRTLPVGSKLALTSEVAFRGGMSPQTTQGTVGVGQPSSVTKNLVYAGPPVAIPDDDPAGVTVSLPATGVGPVSNASVSIDGTSCSTAEQSPTVGLDHTYDGDLAGLLTGPDGTRIQLFSHIGYDGNNFCQTLFGDSGARSIQSATFEQAPYTGKWRPLQPLSVYRGKTGDGTWKFTVMDTTSGDRGTLRKVSIHLNGYVGFTG